MSHIEQQGEVSARKGAKESESLRRFKKNLIALCKIKNVKVKDLSKNTGISPSTLYSLLQPISESNPDQKIVSPGLDKVERIAEAFGVPLPVMISSDLSSTQRNHYSGFSMKFRKSE